MIHDPLIVEVNRQPAASMCLTIPREEIRLVMGPGLAELYQALEVQSIEPAGPWYTHHFRMEPGIFDFEICVPTNGKVVRAGRVQPSEWPAMRVVRALYRGPYSGLPAAWRELDQWVAAEGLIAAGELWERYLIGPDDTREPSQFCTELSRQIIC